jgi:hypothetical protein
MLACKRVDALAVELRVAAGNSPPEAASTRLTPDERPETSPALAQTRRCGHRVISGRSRRPNHVRLLVGTTPFSGNKSRGPLHVRRSCPFLRVEGQSFEGRRIILNYELR